MANSSLRHIRTAKGAMGLGDPPLLAYYSDYAPTRRTEIWNTQLSQFTDDNARSEMLHEFATAIGEELHMVQMKKRGGRSGRTAGQLTKEVKTKLDELNRRCAARHPGTDCPFVRTIKRYFAPVDESYRTGMSKKYDYKSREVTQVQMHLGVEDHMLRFHSRVETAPSTTCTAREEKRGEEQSGPHPQDLQFANSSMAIGACIGKAAAALVLEAGSVIGSSSSAKDW